MSPPERTFQIKPWRPMGATDPQYSEKTWKVLEKAIHDICDQNFADLHFEDLYRCVYHMVVLKHGDKLYSRVVKTMTKHLQAIAKTLQSEPEQEGWFLEALHTKWLQHNKAVEILCDILMYMDRNYVKVVHASPVRRLGLDLWRDQVMRSFQVCHDDRWTLGTMRQTPPRMRDRFLDTVQDLVHSKHSIRQLSDRLLDTVLDLVRRERKGEVINRGLLQSVIKMVSDLGLVFYEEHFEVPFLEAAADFFSLVSRMYIHTSSCTCSEYLRTVETWVHDEIDRVTHYLHPQTVPKIVAVVEREMIANHMKNIIEMENSGLLSMLNGDKYQDLAQMYSLFRAVSGGLEIVRDSMIKNLRETGRHIVMDPERLKDPLEFVQRLLEEKDKYDKFLSLSFGNDKMFQEVVNTAFKDIINLNARSPEFIALFVDDKLQQSSLGVDSEEEVVLEKIAALFRCLQDKDVFEKYYRQHLAKRLLSPGRTSLMVQREASLGN
ncbi:unnamed protein product [Calypogeia fissa]